MRGCAEGRCGRGGGHSLLAVCLASLLTALAPATATAAPSPAGSTLTPSTATSAPTPAVPVPPHLALVLGIDTSGSMAQSDRLGARAVAARQIAAGLSPGDHLGIVGFADAPVVLLPLEAMGTPGSVAAADAAIAGVGASGATDIQGALRVGSDLLAADTNPNDWHVLVLLTDGVADLPSLAAPAAAAAYRAQTDQAATALARKGWVLDTVGLGAGVDGADLASLATAGGGHYVFAADAKTLTQQLLALFAGLQRQVQTQAPPPPAPEPRVTLTAVPVSAPGTPATLALRSTNSAATPQNVTLVPRSLPPGWSLPVTITVPSGQSTVVVPLHGAGWPAARLDIAATAQPPAGVALSGADLTWQLHALPVWRTWPQAHTGWIALGLAALLTLALLAGYAGYVLRVLPRLRPGGSLDVVGSQREPLGRIVIPSRTSVRVGGTACAEDALRLPWIPGSDTLFRIRVALEGSGGLWRMGMAAWRRIPQIVVYVEAEWPYHLYPGLVPQRRVDLYDHTTFGAAGLTFTYHARHRHAGTEVAGTDLLEGIAGPETRGEEGAEPPNTVAQAADPGDQSDGGQTLDAGDRWQAASAGDPGAA